MNHASGSYKSMLRSTSLVGGASVAVLIIGLFRAKAFALLVGPAGIGLLGLLSTLIATAAAIGGMGLNVSAVRALARDASRQDAVRRSIWSLAAILAVTGGLIVWIFRQPLSVAIAGSEDMSTPIGWSAIAVAATILVAVQTAVFQGLQRLRAMAKTNIGGALIGTALSILAVYLWRETGVVVAVIIIPLCMATVGWLLLRGSPASGHRPTSREITAEWRSMIRLGAGVVVTAALGTVAQLALRSIVLRHEGIAGVGLLQAALAISTINVGLVLTAMAADFFPRLSKVSDRPEDMSSLLERQLHLAIILSAPVLIALAAGSGLWLRLLYSSEFAGAADLLRIQVLSETLRVPGWAIGYVLLARNDRRGYVYNELTFMLIAIATALLLVPSMGLAGAGAAYAAGYSLALVVAILRMTKRHRIGVSRSIAFQVGSLFAACLLIFVLGMSAPGIAAVTGALLAVAAGIWALSELHRNDALPDEINRLLRWPR